ncbi:isoform 2 of ankyrin repeat domain-containing protein 17 [Fagus crenata]
MSSWREVCGSGNVARLAQRSLVSSAETVSGFSAFHRLYLAVVRGDWESVKDMPNVQRVITKKSETTLHIAALANQEDFVKNLLKKMNSNDLKAENRVGNNALSYAAATGNVNIAKAMLEKNTNLANLGSGMTPLKTAVFFEQSQMVEYLSTLTRIKEWDTTKQVEIFVTYVTVGMYGKALEMLKDNLDLATTKNKYDETALHVLACNPLAFASGSQPGSLRSHINSCELF